MKICAIICEYNPIHEGHIYQIKQTRAITGCDYIIAIMSGSFTQRGIPAIYDKWLRTTAALQSGIDMVIELPAAFSVASAERFAFGGVSIANAIGAVDYLSFGCETDNIELLSETADMLVSEPEEYLSLLKSQLSAGVSYASARAFAVQQLIPDAKQVLNSPNAILGVEYIKALKRLNSKIRPFTVKRIGQDETDSMLTSAFPSALAIRRAVQRGADCSQLVPADVSYLFRNAVPVFYEDMFYALKYKILSMSSDKIASAAGVSEGLENLIIYAAKNACSMDELINSIKSKRYALTRICRILTNLLLDISKEDYMLIDSAGIYARVLGIKKGSEKVLSEITRKSSVPVIINPKSSCHPGIKKDVFASDVRSVFDKNKCGRDYTEKFIVV